MPIGARVKSAAVAVAILVTAILGAPAFATSQPEGDPSGVTQYAKPSDKPRPSHPRATPTPGPTPTPRITPAPTPKVTPKPGATPAPEATPRTTNRPGPDTETPRPSKRLAASAGASGDGESPPDTAAPGANVGGGGGAGIVGPKPEALALAAFLAAFVGLASVRILVGRRRRRPLTPAPAVTKAGLAPSADEWTNVRLDDNDALPSWLRAVAEPEHSPLSWTNPRFRAESPSEREPLLTADPAPEHEHPARPVQTFADPVEAGAMRLAITAGPTELLDQPTDLGVVLTTLIVGDEIEIRDIEEPWVCVVTPFGATGWLRSESLAVGSSPPEEPEPDEPEPDEPPAPKRRGGRSPRRSRSPRPAA